MTEPDSREQNDMSDPISDIKGRLIPVKYLPDSVVTAFANHFVIQHTEHEFTISFYQINQPVLVGPTEESELLKLESIEAKCVARIAFARSRMPEIMAMFVKNFMKSEEKFTPKENAQ